MANKQITTVVVNTTQKRDQSVKKRTINGLIKRNKSLIPVLEDYLHLSTTTGEYQLLKDINIIHLRNIAKKELAKWNTKTSYTDYVSSNKYIQELNRRNDRSIS